MRLLLANLLVCIFVVPGVGQQKTNSEVPSPEESIRHQQAQEQRVEKSLSDLRKMNNPAANQTIFPRLQRSSFPPESPKPSSEQLIMLQPDAEISARYTEFLKTPKTGLIKLFPDLDCESDLVVRADKICENAIPQSSFYSFRRAQYSTQSLSDIKLKYDFFISAEQLLNGIIVRLGDVPIESVSLNSNGMKFLTEYQSAKTDRQALDKFNQLSEGIKEAGYIYGASAPVTENMTYVVRAIAYRGGRFKTAGQFYYDVFAGDKRADITVVFRVVEKDKDGTVTLLWKELKRNDSPKI